MKITKKQLKRIIQEEIGRVMSEADEPSIKDLRQRFSPAQGEPGYQQSFNPEHGAATGHDEPMKTTLGDVTDSAKEGVPPAGEAKVKQKLKKLGAALSTLAEFLEEFGAEWEEFNLEIPPLLLEPTTPQLRSYKEIKKHATEVYNRLFNFERKVDAIAGGIEDWSFVDPIQELVFKIDPSKWAAHELMNAAEEWMRGESGEEPEEEPERRSSSRSSPREELQEAIRREIALALR